MSSERSEELAGRALASIAPVNPVNFLAIEEMEKEKKALEEESTKITQAYYVRIKALKDAIATEWQKCNHVGQDGKSTWGGIFYFSSCSLCGENDL